MRASTTEIGTQSSPAGDAGLRQFTPSPTEKGTQKSRKQMVETGTDAYPTLSAPIQAEPLPEAIVQPPHALIDTTPQPLVPPPILVKAEEENKYEEEEPQSEPKEEEVNPPGLTQSQLQKNAVEIDNMDKVVLANKKADELLRIVRSLGVSISKKTPSYRSKPFLLRKINEAVQEILTGGPKIKAKSA